MWYLVSCNSCNGVGNGLRSTDYGSSWDNVTSGTGNVLDDVAFGNNTFVVSGAQGAIVRSTDNGTTWDDATVPAALSSHRVWAAGFGNNTFVGTTQHGTIVR